MPISELGQTENGGCHKQLCNEYSYSMQWKRKYYDMMTKNTKYFTCRILYLKKYQGQSIFLALE